MCVVPDGEVSSACTLSSSFRVDLNPDAICRVLATTIRESQCSHVEVARQQSRRACRRRARLPSSRSDSSGGQSRFLIPLIESKPVTTYRRARCAEEMAREAGDTTVQFGRALSCQKFLPSRAAGKAPPEGGKPATSVPLFERSHATTLSL